MAITEELMARKLKNAEADYRVSSSAVRILNDLQQHTPQADVETFRKVILRPLIRRQAKAAQAVMFWSDKAQVDSWMASSAQRYLEEHKM